MNSMKGTIRIYVSLNGLLWLYMYIHISFVFQNRMVHGCCYPRSVWPSGIIVACVCLSDHVSITWLRSWLSRSNLISKSKFTPFWACPHDNSSPIQSRTTKFGPVVQNTLVKIPIVLRVDWARQIKLFFPKSCLFASLLRLWHCCI